MNILMVVNKSQGKLGPSETFLQSQITDLPGQVTLLIGNPGERRVGDNSNKFLLTNSVLGKGFRRCVRKVSGTTLEEQDSRALTDYLKSNNFDVVLAQYGPTAVSVMSACEQTQTPLVAHFHGYDAYVGYYLEKYKTEYRSLFKSAAAIVAVSTHMKRQLESLGAEPSKVHYSACGADTPVGFIKDKDTPSKTYAMVGRLTDKKAPIVSIIAFSQLLNDHPGSTLEIIGDGPLMDQCVSLAKSLNISDSVIFHGAQPHEEVVSLLERSRLFLQHSVTAPNGDMEGTPVGVLEAMAMGLPVVSTKHGGIMDVIDSSNLGTLVDEYDLKGMSEALKSLADDDKLIREIGDNAQKRVQEKWTNQHSIDRLAKILSLGSQNLIWKTLLPPNRAYLCHQQQAENAS